jgi:L-asparagine transporter-like permease
MVHLVNNKMEKSVQDKEVVKKRAIRTSIIFFIFILLCIILPSFLTESKIPLAFYIIMIAFLVVIISSSVIGYKFRDKIKEPKTQNILGYIVGGLALLQIILYLIADLLEGKINIRGLIISGIILVCFLTVGIILIRKSKKKD